MLSVEETIAAYANATAAGDPLGAAKALQSLEDERFRNDADWQLIHDFLRSCGFDARLEMITLGLIRSGRTNSIKPYLTLAGLLVRSGRLAEARPLLAVYKAQKQQLNPDQWDYVTLLFETEQYDDCLAEVHKALEKKPGDYPYLITEVRLYWRKGERKLARKGLAQIRKRLDAEPDEWVWYLMVAQECEEYKAANEAVNALLAKLKAGTIRLTASVIDALRASGYEDDLFDIIQACRTEAYASIEACVALFNIAVEQGVSKTALAFGDKILSLDPGHHLRERIEDIRQSRGFLMR